MNTRSVIVDKVTNKDFADFYKEHSIFNMLDIEISEVKMASYIAFKRVNDSLPMNECVTRVLSAISNKDGSYVIRLSILD